MIAPRFGRLVCPTLLFMFAALFAASAWSATDVIYLKNGDKITGAIAKIWDAEIYIEPDYADEFTVDIEAIDYIESDRDFELRISMKEDKPIRFVGKSPEGEQLIERDGEVSAVLLASLAEVEEPEDYLDWSVKGSVGLDFERGNTDTDQSEVRGEGFLKLGDHRHFLTGAILRERANNDSTKRQDRVDYNYNWSFSRPWFLGLNGNYERDPIRDLDYRYIAGITLGRDIWDSAKRFWSIQAGPGVQVQEQSGESDTQGILQYSQRITHKFFSSDMDAFHRHSVTHNLNGRDNTVIRTSTGFEWEFIDDAFWRISYDYDWEENPADDAVAKDERLSFGVGIEFD